MKIGYIRVSTAEQNTIRQEVLMNEFGVDELFIDKSRRHCYYPKTSRSR